MQRLTVPVFALLAQSFLLAQVPPAFEVASVKALGGPNDGAGGRYSTGMPPPITDPGRVDWPNVSLTGVLARAYDVKPLQIVGPDWLRNDRFSIIAKVPADAPIGQVPAMLQSLLAQRFGLTAHLDTRQEQGYSLVVGKAGARLTKTDISDEDLLKKRSSGFRANGHVFWKAADLDDFATGLTVFLASPVVDRTSIEGRFDIAFDADPESMPGFFHGPAGADSPHPSIFEAIRGLGLELRPGKVTVKRLVVDSVKRVPTEN